MTKVVLTSTVTLPVEGGNEVAPHDAGETVDVPEAVAERLVRIGVAEKPSKASTKS